MAQPAWSPDQIARYTCYRTPQPLTIDGQLDKPAWQAALKSPRFVDTVTGAPGWYDTRAACLWDDDYLYVGFWVEEPYIEAHLTERDSIIFGENDVEVFIDGGDCYYEFELNALGTIYEIMFIWRDAYLKGGRFDVPEFDLTEREVFSFAGDYDRQLGSFWCGTHPRGPRWAFLDWDFPGLKWAVQVDGRLNDPTTPDRGWTAEIAFPWNGMHWLRNGRSVPPLPGDVWRLFFGRFQKAVPSGVELSPHPAWVWSPHGIYDTHLPERFPYVTFSEREVLTP
jgi:hypothetical protein